jgi:hypothetical protein
MLVKAWPGSVKQKRPQDGKFPLEIVPPNPAVIRCIEEAWPGAIQEAYANGTLLLHRIVERDGPPRGGAVRGGALSEKWTARTGRLRCTELQEFTAVETVQFLVRQWEESVQARDADGCLPIHRALGNRSCGPLARYLAEQFPASLQATTTTLGHLPLHCAAANDTVSEELVAFFLQQCPEESVRARDRSGALALHHAAAAREGRLPTIRTCPCGALARIYSRKDEWGVAPYS